jgi:hypothetical protein
MEADENAAISNVNVLAKRYPHSTLGFDTGDGDRREAKNAGLSFDKLRTALNQRMLFNCAKRQGET